MKRNSAQRKMKVDPIVIDEAGGLVFNNEQELFNHFVTEISLLEKEFFELRTHGDISEGEFSKYEKNLSVVLEDPDEIWEDSETIEGQSLIVYIREFQPKRGQKGPLYHVAVCYLTGEIPSFVYLHFPTHDASLVEKYRRSQRIYDRSFKDVPVGALEGDALSEADELATGLYKAMMSLRSDKDLPEEAFLEYFQFREPTLGEADEIWRSSDSTGNVLVTFVKDFTDEVEGGELFYIVVTLEDTSSNSHALMFSFPTSDKTLVDRYRHGENLQAEEVVQEASH